jgi:ubiquinone/menaquinone biosynthesis C-methylase UbiE
MAKAFTDHFSSVAGAYAGRRPRYPDTLFAYLATLPAERRLAWDCGAGSGQASLPLVRYFDRVVATDASAAQIGAAEPHPRVEYRVAAAEASGLAARSVDLITVAQALHWFDVDAFYTEARRVLAPGVLGRFKLLQGRSPVA